MRFSLVTRPADRTTLVRRLFDVFPYLAETVMRHLLLALSAIALLATVANADAPTPFVDASRYKVGEMYIEEASLVSLGGTSYLVIVETDTKEYLVLRATAKKGVVADDQLGRAVRVEAKLVAKYARRGVDNNLEIQSVKPIK